MALVQVLGFLNPSVAKLLSNVTLNHPSHHYLESRPLFFFPLRAPLMPPNFSCR